MKARIAAFALVLFASSVHARSPLGITRIGESTFSWHGHELTLTRGAQSTRVKTRLPEIERVLAQGERSVFVIESKTSSTAGGWIRQQLVEQLDAQGTSLGVWDVEGTELALTQDAAFTLMGNKIVRLEAQGRTRKVADVDPREKQLLVSHSGQLVACRSRVHGHRELDRAGCRALGSWSFVGHWDGPGPLLCGEWLVEPAEAEHKLRVRTMATGEVVAESALTTRELACDGLIGLVDLSNQQWLSLPKLEPRKLACGGGKMQAFGNGACLDVKGHVATLAR